MKGTEAVVEEPGTRLAVAVMGAPGDPLSPVSAALPADRNPALVYLARLAPGSRPAMAKALDTIAGILTSGAATARTLPWHLVRYQHAQAVRATLADRFQPATVNRYLSALRGVLDEARALGWDCGEAFRVKGVKNETLPAGRSLDGGELRSLFQACRPGPGGSRNAALLAILYGSGLRRAEAVGLDLDDYDSATGALRVRAGKGRKDRTSYLAAGGRAAVEGWLQHRGQGPGPLLFPVGKGGTLTPRRMTTQAAYDALQRLALRAGVTKVSPHDLRRSFVSDLLDAGADLPVVQRLAGHASPTTTSRYDRRPEGAKRRAAGLLHIPFSGSAMA
ncbi:MAG: tyrosine-type recombinase/integrase [Planctomycetes bacterium]|nr:tyrosine-type recombinase/integrase [Planctomycetota bacterium]